MTILLRVFCFSLLALTGVAPAYSQLSQELTRSDLPPPPVNLVGVYSGRVGGSFVLAGGQLESGQLSPVVYALPDGGQQWMQLGELEQPRAFGSSAASGNDLYLVGGLDQSGDPTDAVTRLRYTSGSLSAEPLPSLPKALYRPAATIFGGKLYVAGGSVDTGSSEAVDDFYVLDLAKPSAGWLAISSWGGPGRHSAFLIGSIESLYLIGGVTADGSKPTLESYHPRYGWRTMGPTPDLQPGATVARIGEAHVLTLTGGSAETGKAYLYHTVGDTWLPVDEFLGEIPLGAEVAGGGGLITMVAPNSAVGLSFGNPRTNYGWWDHIAVALYFGVMIYVGFHFTKQKSSTQNYFRGGNRIPWWATGMSLFATGASAVSLLAMPGKSYSTNWTFFTISIYSVLCLPLSMYLLAPLVRKLNFGTAFEYLEHRFGLSVRMFGSAIFVLQQILGRMGPVMLLPSIAMAAITGIDIKTCIIAMGIVTTLYTFLGGLSAVIWTDTIQGLVMVLAVFGCLVLVYFSLDMPPGEMWTTLQSQQKLHMFDLGWEFTGNTALMMFLGVIAITLFGISDQNYVQRVQCTPTLEDAKKAIATQMAVAVPINVLLFALGTALFLFYRQHPDELNPVMQNDGIFPFFAAQQLPPGVSGLVVAALLAATMSTISSSICSVSNLGVDDFYKRFFRAATDSKAVVIGRALTVIVGGLGIGAALFLSEFQTPSIWELALQVISFITSATLGMFGLGLLTRKSNEIGVIVGIVAGIASTYYVQTFTDISYWIYPITGSIVTAVVGYAVSLATGGNRKNIDGLTVYTLQKRKGGLDD